MTTTETGMIKYTPISDQDKRATDFKDAVMACFDGRNHMLNNGQERRVLFFGWGCPSHASLEKWNNWRFRNKIVFLKKHPEKWGAGKDAWVAATSSSKDEIQISPLGMDDASYVHEMAHLLGMTCGEHADGYVWNEATQQVEGRPGFENNVLGVSGVNFGFGITDDQLNQAIKQGSK